MKSTSLVKIDRARLWVSFCISFPPIAQPGAEDHDANDKDCRPSYADQPSDFIWGYCRHRGDGKPAILLIHFDL